MSAISFGSVCSGIEAASVAWHPLGWRAAWLAEIEPFPSAVLAHHYPDTPNLGDMTRIARLVLQGDVEAPDVLTGGTPCQAFSVAGLRESLADARGNLTLKFVELADAIDLVRGRAGKPASIVIWENVPGVLSTKDNAFGCFLAGLAGEDGPLEPPEARPATGKSSRYWKWDRKLNQHVPSWANAGCVYGPQRAVAWRTLDAQYFGLAQRRRRVFVVASARNGFDPAQVLFEWDGVRRDSAPRRGEGAGSSIGTLGGTSPGGGWRFGADEAAAGQLITGALTSHAKGDNPGQESKLLAFGGNYTGGPREVASALSALSAHGGTGRHDFESETFITHAPEVAATMVARSSRGGGQTNSPGHNADEELVVTHSLRGEGFDASEDGTGRGTPLVPVQPLPFDTTQITSATNRCRPEAGDPCHPLAAQAHPPAVAFDSYNQRLTGELAGTMSGCDAGNRMPQALQGAQVRRLMPEECEPLQGFPVGYTRIKWRGRPADECPDGPRYKALGNSWAVPVARWVGKRVHQHLEQP